MASTTTQIASMYRYPLYLKILDFFYHYSRRSKKRQINRWIKKLHLDKHETCYQKLYENINGFHLSLSARHNQNALEYTYGEIEWMPFIALLSLTNPNRQTIFYDLGSGIGKAVFACAMVFNVKKSCGVELFKPLHLAAIKQQQRLSQMNEYQNQARALCFINQNFLDVDLSDATLIFINATALFGETWERLQQRLIHLKPNTIIITTSKYLSANHFILTKKTLVQMSWGPVHAFIHKKILV